MSACLLSAAFSQYDLEIPSDLCAHVKNFLKSEAHICCEKCCVELLNAKVTKPFIKRVPSYYKVFEGNVFTADGVLSRVFSDNECDLHLDSLESVYTAVRTPDMIDICGIVVKNEVKVYEQSRLYKCVYYDDRFVYLCVHCFLFTRKLRRSFYEWKNLRT